MARATTNGSFPTTPHASRVELTVIRVRTLYASGVNLTVKTAPRFATGCKGAGCSNPCIMTTPLPTEPATLTTDGVQSNMCHLMNGEDTDCYSSERNAGL